MAASTASHRPIKGILKNKSSTTSTVVGAAEQPDPRGVPEELSKTALEARTVLAPFPAADPDYGLLHVPQPGSPDHRRKLAAAKGSEIKFRVQELESSGDEDNDLSPEEREKKRQFEIKRKLHYNEGLNIKLARELISKDLNEDEREEEQREEGEQASPQESSPGSTVSDQPKPKSQSS
ncbi:protein phosphatase inhibitor 2-like isoform X3 [Sorex araneus]|uniref:protein phosphatase inhibitor 2-like isoform X3 n=1 Tax=Sorex araneus TaxID=42254 RepID=UPI002433B496|nr:protein phosphatase inhibitor 2-like isoform X3 [Sorex araneus]